MDDFFTKIRSGATTESDNLDRQRITVDTALDQMDVESDKVMVTNNMESMSEEDMNSFKEATERIANENNTDNNTPNMNQKTILGLKPINFGLLAVAVIVVGYFVLTHKKEIILK